MSPLSRLLYQSKKLFKMMTRRGNSEPVAAAVVDLDVDQPTAGATEERITDLNADIVAATKGIAMAEEEPSSCVIRDIAEPTYSSLGSIDPLTDATVSQDIVIILETGGMERSEQSQGIDTSPESGELGSSNATEDLLTPEDTSVVI